MVFHFYFIYSDCTIYNCLVDRNIESVFKKVNLALGIVSLKMSIFAKLGGKTALGRNVLREY